MEKTRLSTLFCAALLAVCCLRPMHVHSQELASTNGRHERDPMPLQNTYRPLKEVMNDLKAKRGIYFMFNSKDMKDKMVNSTFDFSDNIDSILTHLLKPLGFAYKKVGNIFVIVEEADKPTNKEVRKKLTKLETDSFVNFLTNHPVTMSTVTAAIVVSGKVTDEKGEPIPGANVVLKGTTVGAITDSEGNYRINVPDSSGTLVFSFVGYLKEEVQINNQTTININLLPDISTLSEVVVVGYGTRKKDELSGAVTQVTSATITKQPVTSFDQALVGQVPGMTIREGTGAPGAGPEILVRGINTFGSNKPLIVIDDVIFENYNDQNNNPLALLNPEDIESVSVLKDAATKAIYGSRATAGVIIVTTKRGKTGEPTFTFNTSVGSATVMPFEKPNVMNAQELAQFRRESSIDRIRFTNPLYKDPAVAVPDSLIPEALRNPGQYGKGTDWFDEITQRALVQNYNLSVNGGTESVRYFVSANYLGQEGVVLNTDIQRLSLRANLDIKLSKKLRMGLNLSPSRTTQNRPSDEPSDGTFSAYSTITSTYWVSPEAKVYDENGNINYLTTSPLTTSWTVNPVYQLQAEREERLANQLVMGSFLEYEIIPDLTIKTNLSYSNNIRRSRNFSPSTVAGDGLNPILPRLTGATAKLFNENFSNLISDNTIRYRLVKNMHNLELLAGFTVQDVITENSTLNAQRLLDENLYLASWNNVDKTSSNNFTGNEGFTQNRIISYISRANYILNDKYFFNLSVRRDASSRFGRSVQSAVFPAGSVAWRVSNEGFLQSMREAWLDELRIEVGYGVTGNQQGIGDYGFLGNVTQANYIFGGVSTLGNTLSALPNDNITWEQSKQLDLGLNMSLFKRRITLSFNTYKQVTDGLLSFIPLPLITGFGGVQGNGGRIQNTGFEVQIDGVIIAKKRINWTSSINFSRYKNKILELTNGTFYSGNAGNGSQITISQEGQPVGMYYALKTLGLFTAEEIADPTVPKYVGAAEGTMKYVDGNGNGLLESFADHVVVGNPHPDLMFGWTNQVSAYGFNLRTIFAGQLGGAIMDLREEIMYNVDGNFNVHRDLLDRYRPGDDPTQETNATTATGTPQFRWPNDRRITDGSYVSLKNVTLGYDLAKFLNKKAIPLKSAELYVSMRNVFYIANYKEGNPEIRRSNDGSAVRSVNYGSYPISRTTTLGLNVSF